MCIVGEESQVQITTEAVEFTVAFEKGMYTSLPPSPQLGVKYGLSGFLVGNQYGISTIQKLVFTTPPA